MPRRCFVASPAARPRIRCFTLTARSLEVGSCSTGVSRWAGAAGAEPAGFGAGLVLLGVTGGPSGPGRASHLAVSPSPAGLPSRPFRSPLPVLPVLFVLKSQQAGRGACPLAGVCLFSFHCSRFL